MIAATNHLEAPHDFIARGVDLIECTLSPENLAAIESRFPNLPPRTPGARTGGFTPEAQAWFSSFGPLIEIASRMAGRTVRLSRLQAFDKSPQSNWFMPWHQDRAEDGREREVAHLENTVALRIHLDDCGADNGPLEVVPGSHLHGRLDAEAIAALVASLPSNLCLASRGDILAMRPLIVHRSQRARIPAARRVVHIEYTA